MTPTSVGHGRLLNQAPSMNDTLFSLLGWAIIATLVVGIGFTLEFALRGLANRYGTP